ncbi:signal peptidase I [Kitasatospora paranensis]|uniref:signal peptidase I n=1 Tax=Kitasatospora paranensis TaxID=258053 RepID=UPI0031E7F037
MADLTTGYRRVTVVGGAMAPTLGPGDRLLVADVAPAEVHDGDLVLVDVPEFVGDSGSLAIKRVLGVGGDRLSCCGGPGIRRNGSALAEPYVRGATRTFDLTVAQHHLFLLGDNRPDSVDSQYPQLLRDRSNGTVPDTAVRGRVVWASTGAVAGPEAQRVSDLMLRSAIGVVLTLVGVIALPTTLVLSSRRRRRPSPRSPRSRSCRVRLARWDRREGRGQRGLRGFRAWRRAIRAAAIRCRWVRNAGRSGTG